MHWASNLPIIHVFIFKQKDRFSLLISIISTHEFVGGDVYKNNIVKFGSEKRTVVVVPSLVVHNEVNEILTKM